MIELYPPRGTTASSPVGLGIAFSVWYFSGIAHCFGLPVLFQALAAVSLQLWHVGRALLSSESLLWAAASKISTSALWGWFGQREPQVLRCPWKPELLNLGRMKHCFGPGSDFRYNSGTLRWWPKLRQQEQPRSWWHLGHVSRHID